MKTLIIQTSPYHTASTLLVNALYGLIPELSNKKIIGDWMNNYGDWIKNYDKILEENFNDIIVIKSHHRNIDELTAKYKDKYKLFFICSQRIKMNLLIDKKYNFYNNVIIFNYIELNETKNYCVSKIIQNIYDRINNKLNIELNIESGINRVIQMNNRYKEIKNYPFKYVDPFFQIHGSHRNRSNNH